MASDRRQDLLKWSIENMREGGVEEKDVQRVQAVPKEWRDAILGTSDVERMKGIIVQLEKMAQLSEEDILDCMEEIQFMVELTHNANDFPKIGGADVLLNAVQHELPSVRRIGSRIIATSAANNPEFHKLFAKHSEDGASRVMALFQSETEDSVAADLLFAVSALTREDDTNLAMLLALRGVDSVIACLSRENEKLQRRAVFFLDYLVQTKPKYQVMEAVKASSCASALLSLLQRGDISTQENTMSLLSHTLAVDPIWIPSEIQQDMANTIGSIVESLKQEFASDMEVIEGTLSHARGILAFIKS